MWDRLNSEQDTEETSFFEGGGNRPSIFDEPPEVGRTAFERFQARSSRISASSFANNELAEQAYLQSQEFEDLAMPMSFHKEGSSKDYPKLYTFNGDGSAASSKMLNSFDRFGLAEYEGRAPVRKNLFGSEVKGDLPSLMKQSNLRSNRYKQDLRYQSSTWFDKSDKQEEPSQSTNQAKPQDQPNSQFSFNVKGSNHNILDNYSAETSNDTEASKQSMPKGVTSVRTSSVHEQSNRQSPDFHPSLQKKLLTLNQLPPKNLLLKTTLPTISEASKEYTAMAPANEADQRLSVAYIMRKKKHKAQATPIPRLSGREYPAFKRTHEVPAELLPILYELSEAIEEKSPEPLKIKRDESKFKLMTPIPSPSLSINKSEIKELNLQSKQYPKKESQISYSKPKLSIVPGRISPILPKFELNLPFGRKSEANKSILHQSIKPQLQGGLVRESNCNVPLFGMLNSPHPPPAGHFSNYHPILTLSNDEYRSYEEWKQIAQEYAETSYNLALDRLRMHAVSAAIDALAIKYKPITPSHSTVKQ